jgi:putative membrane protein
MLLREEWITRERVVWGKIGVGLFWIAVLANLMFPLPPPWGMLLSIAGLISLGAHVLQSVVFAWRFRVPGRSLSSDIVQILLFGAVHLASVKLSRA